MAIIGDLVDLGVADLLYMVKMRGMSGRLALEREGRDADLYFTNGRLVQVRSSQVTRRLGELLVEMKKLSEAQLAEALARQAASGEGLSFGALLMQDGLVSDDDLAEVLTCQAEEILYRVLGWSEGAFAYTAVPLPAEAVPLPDINVERLILDAIRLADEAEATLAHIPSLDCSVTLTPTADATTDLSLKESMVAAGIRHGAVTVREIAQTVYLAEVELLRLIDDLAARGLVTVTLPPGMEPAIVSLPDDLAPPASLPWDGPLPFDDDLAPFEAPSAPTMRHRPAGPVGGTKRRRPTASLVG